MRQANRKRGAETIREIEEEFFADFMKYPYQLGSSLTVSNINYQTLRVAEAMQRLGKIKELAPPRN